MKPRSSTVTPAASAPISLPFGRRPTATSTRSKTSVKAPFGPSIATSSPVSSAFTPVTLALRWIAS